MNQNFITAIFLPLLLLTSRISPEEIDAMGSDLPARIKKSFVKMIPKIDPEKCVWAYNTVSTEYSTTCSFEPDDAGLTKVFFKMKESGGPAVSYLETTDQDFQFYLPGKVEEKAAKYMQKISAQNNTKIVFYSGKIYLDANGKHTRYELEYWNHDTITCLGTFDRTGKPLHKGVCRPM